MKQQGLDYGTPTHAPPLNTVHYPKTTSRGRISGEPGSISAPLLAPGELHDAVLVPMAVQEGDGLAALRHGRGVLVPQRHPPTQHHAACHSQPPTESVGASLRPQPLVNLSAVHPLSPTPLACTDRFHYLVVYLPSDCPHESASQPRAELRLLSFINICRNSPASLTGERSAV